ncbi:MAG: prepilin-type N-terminal cleavage/methylation domain-containing protein, partial [Phycisphaerales bacterium]|nr:prepilin-type N-terminal cleavage/methylation domain-containing protein [Phycisphaerales bacterium]
MDHRAFTLIELLVVI